MEYKVNELTDSQREVEVTLTYDEIKKELQAEVQKQTKNIQMPGFRKGKVPMHMLKKMYGDALEYDASEKVANTKFWDIAKEKSLNPIGQPQLVDIKYNPSENLSFKVRYEVLPELEVSNYKDLEVEIPDLTVKDQDVDHEIEHILKANQTTEDAEVVGEDNNYTLNVEVQRVDENGNAVENSKPETIDIDLSNERVNAEIVTNARGKKTGDTFSFSFKDEHTHKVGDKEEVHSEQYNYNAKINSIKKIKLPELNEELIKKATKDKLSTEQELRDGIKKDIQNYYDQRVDEMIRNKLLQQIVENNDFIPPQAMVKNVLEDLVKQEEERAKKQGYKKFNKADAEKALEKSAELEVKWFLIKRAIEKQENITIADEDFQELAKKDAEKTGLPEDKLISYYKSSNVSENILDTKLFKFLKEQTKVKKVNPDSLINKETEETNDKEL